MLSCFFKTTRKVLQGPEALLNTNCIYRLKIHGSSEDCEVSWLSKVVPKIELIIISGGQTGVDRTAWDVAKELEIPHSGYVPKGRLAEDGIIGPQYNCEEIDRPDYIERTEKNVILGDATLIVAFGALFGGTQMTVEFCKKHQRPFHVADLHQGNVLSNLGPSETFLRQVIEDISPTTFRLNVAGPRGSHPKFDRGSCYQFLRLLFAYLSDDTSFQPLN